MTENAILITGANGEIGHALLRVLDADRVVALDLKPLDQSLRGFCREFVQGDVRDEGLFQELGQRFTIESIFHLAAILSTRAEQDLIAAHEVNVEGTLNVLRFGLAQAETQSRSVQFLFPSTIAVYGFPNAQAKFSSGPVREDEHLTPGTIYGASKLYGEHLGQHFSRQSFNLLDFRALRFPGLISAETRPAGGTTDYGPEMLHSAAAGRAYRCFVRPETVLPFMAMPDAVRALLELAAGPPKPRRVYNVASFSPSAHEIHELVLEHFPGAQITFESDPNRQAIVDGWPDEVDDSAAKRDWGWASEYDLVRAFSAYLIPALSRGYQQAS